MVDLLHSATLGAVAGLIPVYIGLAPLWFFRRLSDFWRSLLVSVSAGILLFLFANVTHEAIAFASEPGVGSLLFAGGLVLGFVGPAAIAHYKLNGRNAQNEPKIPGPLFVAYMIALAIGLHNFGEGLAIGAAYAADRIVLTTVLVIGFALHNGTEGLGIAGPITTIQTGVKAPALMGFVAGFPTILGSLIGSVAFSESIGSLFFSAASGALLYVIIELVRISYPKKTASTILGITLGILIMYFTGLLVPA